MSSQIAGGRPPAGCCTVGGGAVGTSRCAVFVPFTMDTWGIPWILDFEATNHETDADARVPRLNLFVTKIQKADEASNICLNI